ncbi:hypothetical protein LUZ60_001250 [Juncus effusus]|nr:hypothetical protein LUZ60_001250 [Juncus effusus]
MANSNLPSSLPSILTRYLPLALLFSLLYLFTKEWLDTGPSNPIPLPQPTQDPLDSELEYDFPPFVRLYKSGRVERLYGTAVVPASAFPTPGVVSKDVIINEKTGLSARLYMPEFTKEKLPILIYVHGGAFVIQSAFSPTYQVYLKTLVLKGNLVIVSVEYRLAPEHPLPVAYNDTFEAVKWVLSNAMAGPEKFLSEHGDLTRIFVAGESAGGNIAHNVVMLAGKEGLNNGVRIKGLVLMNPYFWGKDPVGKETRKTEVRRIMESTWGFVCGRKYGIDHPFVNPVSLKEEWKKLGCERVLVTVSELDLFRARGVAYVEELEKSGWNGTMEIYETMGEDHCYYISKPDLDKSKKEMERVIAFFNRP